MRDRLLTNFDSPIMDDENELLSEMMAGEGLAVTGKLSLGKNGHNVTIVVEDEETGEVLEINHVQTALLVIEDKRSKSSGWLSIAIGNMSKLSEVLEFLSKTTLEGLKKMMGL